MLKKVMLLLLFSAVFSKYSSAQSEKHLKEINIVWQQFYQAFETLDYQPMAAIHSKSLIRISGGKRIQDFTTYIDNYKKRFKDAKRNNVTNHISLRFFERINNDAIASERGIYKLIVNKGQDNEQIYYGQFHVILKKEASQWKITMDYDSNESNTIGEEHYLKSYRIDDFQAFIKS